MAFEPQDGGSALLSLSRRAHLTPLFHASPVCKEEGEALRMEYLQNIIYPDWHARLLQRAQAGIAESCTCKLLVAVTAATRSSPAENPDSEQDHLVQTQDAEAPMPAPKRQQHAWMLVEHGPNVVHELTTPFYIGRHAVPHVGAGIMLNVSAQNYSRCCLFVLSSPNELMVIDPGSIGGIRVVSRSSGLPCEHSLPDDRKVLKFRIDETVCLRLGYGSIMVQLNAKPCVVCLDLRRDVRLPCGHAVLCHACARHLRRSGQPCPVCNAPCQAETPNNTHNPLSYVP